MRLSVRMYQPPRPAHVPSDTTGVAKQGHLDPPNGPAKVKMVHWAQTITDSDEVDGGAGQRRACEEDDACVIGSLTSTANGQD